MWTSGAHHADVLLTFVRLLTGSSFARYIGRYAGTIAGGTSEIQRNIIAQRILGLP